MLTWLALSAALSLVAFGTLQRTMPSPLEVRLRYLSRPAPERKSRGWVSALGAQLQPRVKGLAIAPVLETRLGQADIALSVGEFLGLSGLLALVFLSMGLVTCQGPWGLVLAPFGGALPFLYLGLKLRRQRQAFLRQLPDAILLLINALRSGNGLRQALQVLVQQTSAPMATELGTVLREVNWGIPLEEALGRLRERMQSVDVDLLVSAISIHHETGGRLSEILTNLHDTIRDRVRVEGEIRALTAQGRLSGWILALLPVVLALTFSLVSPGYLGLLVTDPRGQAMLGGGAVLEIVGMLLIRRLVRIRY